MTAKEYPLIHQSVLDDVRRPIEQAHGMPNQAYDDPNYFEFERDHVMAKTWAGLCFNSELPCNGYAKPIEFMGLPLVVVRDKVGDIKVFHNVCSHRGMILVNEEKEVGALLRCPYHSWSYELNGNLKSTPHIGGINQNTAEGFSCEGNGLKPVRSNIWMGIIFINLSGDAIPFEDFITPLQTRWEAFTGEGEFDRLSPAKTGSHAQLTVNCNWKLAIENYCEAYHLPWVHPGLNSYSPLDQHYNLYVNEYGSGQGSYSYTLADVAGTKLPQFTQWPKQQISQAEYVSLYPNILLGIQADHAFAIILQPMANNLTIEKLELSYIDDAAFSDQHEKNRLAVLASWVEVFKEDIFAVESMQKGRRSPGYQGGVFSPVMDGPTHHFHQWVAGQYSQAMHGHTK
ncbi:aromatic ring-hydroxylating oxygenase subunit alpha [Leucothrix pacifica]|uniref:2Fe-2S ferredoxin n=1 Tax=Leucothrix pacifica TaxID=1247513 RepID=A0A317C2L7_9GAMM|nr:aromatic ring-hydroxylating dioxygenase subunit alpha [Leucothrix pacifica]PWQ92579.1 2Fe-2S ferredoxin [Leucothrix pacifica]